MKVRCSNLQITLLCSCICFPAEHWAYISTILLKKKKKKKDVFWQIIFNLNWWKMTVLSMCSCRDRNMKKASSPKGQLIARRRKFRTTWPKSKHKQKERTSSGQAFSSLSFLWNMDFLIFVYLSFNLASAPAFQSKTNPTARICCDVRPWCWLH